MILVMVFTLIFLFVTHCDLLLFASFSSLFSSISRMRQSSMLVRGVNLYLCHNMQVRFLQQTLFFTFSANPLHPFLLLDPRLLSRIPRQLVVLWMRTNMKGSVSLVILGQTCNSCKGLAFLSGIFPLRGTVQQQKSSWGGDGCTYRERHCSHC